VRQAEESDAVITTYAIAHRDRETLQRVHWQRVVLDEAQYIKNPGPSSGRGAEPCRATRGSRSRARRWRTALSELWSILDFLNPSYLGPSATFRKRFSVPVEPVHDAARGRQLRELVRPFILRRLKSDPGVAADSRREAGEPRVQPPDQRAGALYESVVGRMLAEVDNGRGIPAAGARALDAGEAQADL
jgi:SNF2 family DNA or RNA helicase